MRLPSLGLSLCLLVALPAAAGGPESSVLRELPARFSARQAPPTRHVPSPFPDDGDLEYKGDGAGPWLIGAGVLATGAVVSGIVAAAAHGRSNATEDPAEADQARKTRDTAGITAAGLAGGAGVCLVLNQVW